MTYLKFSASAVILATFLFVAACKHAKTETDSGYPPEIRSILVNKCATAGCHNAASYYNAGGLLLDTWEHLFRGGSSGSVAVPYSPEYSSLLYFVNTDTLLGIVAEPSMPKDAAPLSREEYLILRDWIANGAHDREGNIPFGSNPDTRQKIYLTQQACDDRVTVIDAATQLVMRYIPVGVFDGVPESAHYVRFTQDGKYAFVAMLTGLVQKIDVATDKVVGSYPLGIGSWNIVHPDSLGNRFIASNKDGGQVTYWDILSGKHITYSSFPQAHGIAPVPSFDTFYITDQTGNVLYNTRLSLTSPAPETDDILLSESSVTQPHEVLFSPDRSKLFVTCEVTNEVRVVDPHTNKLMTGLPSVIKVGTKPQEMAYSLKKPYLFVTCMEDPLPELSTPLVKFRGSIYVIDYNTHQVVKVIKDKFANVHGVTVDDRNNKVYFASTNTSTDGPSAHHPSKCGGNNGYYHVYDLNTLEPVDGRRFEVLAWPYSFDVRFK
ncbi:MAG: hypothetical protein EOP51_01390 [Sphingobacteriales bacterium]|nr:MAG: hypothetical protein EOP51_01390 [Sphingobacteriales bacterium]